MTIVTDGNEALAADDVQTEAVVLGVIIGDGIKIGSKAALHLVAGMQFIAGQGTKPLTAFLYIGRRDGVAILEHPRRTIPGRAPEIVD